MKRKIILAFRENHEEMLNAKNNDDFENFHECKGFETALLFVLGLYGISFEEAMTMK